MRQDSSSGTHNLKLLNNADMVNWLNFGSRAAVDQTCEGCTMGKQQGQPFPEKAKSITTELLELIHRDVCGSVDVPSVGGSRYFATVINDFSRYTTVYMIRSLLKFREFC